MTLDYKKYSLEKLQELVHDAMNSDASPHEIYSTIREAVREEYYYHKDCISRASGLLELLSGHRPVSTNDPWNATMQKSEYYYDYNRNDLNRENPFKDKVVKWQLPVQLDDVSGEYYVIFPDDLLDTANLKEGDQVEWVDNGDGSCLLRKVNDVDGKH